MHLSPMLARSVNDIIQELNRRTAHFNGRKTVCRLCNRLDGIHSPDCVWAAVHVIAKAFEEEYLTVRREVVCLCGSSRFSEAYQQANLKETLAGKIVLTIGCDFKSDDAIGLDDTDKQKLDALHLEKIALCDTVLVLDVDGYIGESTSKEIAHAQTLGKRLRYWSKEHPEEEDAA